MVETLVPLSYFLWDGKSFEIPGFGCIEKLDSKRLSRCKQALATLNEGNDIELKRRLTG